MSEEAQTKTDATHRPYDEACKQAKVAQWASGVPAKRVAEGLGITTESLRAWRRPLGGTEAMPATVVDGKLPTLAPSAQKLRGRGIVGRVRGRRRPLAIDSDHEQPIAPDRLGQREAPVARLNEAWAADITYVPTDEGWLYLAGVLDLGSRRLVGWAMGASLETTLPTAALQMALRQRQPWAGLLHHSDRGCQYASEACREHLAAWKVTPSRSRKGNCYDNAAMESFWSTLKEEQSQPHPFCEPCPGCGRDLRLHRDLLQP